MNRYAILMVVSADSAEEAENGVLEWTDRDASIQYVSHPLQVPERDGAYDVDTLLGQCIVARSGQ